jgi:hypothetical protein
MSMLFIPYIYVYNNKQRSTCCSNKFNNSIKRTHSVCFCKYMTICSFNRAIKKFFVYNKTNSIAFNETRLINNNIHHTEYSQCYSLFLTSFLIKDILE